MAVGGFLAGYTGATRTSYTTDLRVFATWCRQADLGLLSVKRSHLELFGRWMEETGRMRSTVARRLSTLASFYRYCEQEQLIDRNPALNVRRPKVDYESRTLGLDRNELGAFLVQAGLGSPRDHGQAPGAAGGDHQAHQPPQSSPLLHHGCPRRRRAPAGPVEVNA